MLRTERKAEKKVIALQEALKQANTILIGAGTGLSAFQIEKGDLVQYLGLQKADTHKIATPP